MSEENKIKQINYKNIKPDDKYRQFRNTIVYLDEDVTKYNNTNKIRISKGWDPINELYCRTDTKNIENYKEFNELLYKYFKKYCIKSGFDKCKYINYEEFEQKIEQSSNIFDETIDQLINYIKSKNIDVNIISCSHLYNIKEFINIVSIDFNSKDNSKYRINIDLMFGYTILTKLYDNQYDVIRF